MSNNFNLISDAWIPVRRRSGLMDSIKPRDLLDPEDPPISLMWPRPDLNLANLALLTGLIHAAMPPEDDDEWTDLHEASPDLDRLTIALEKLSEWFFLDGDGPKFMQDLDPLEGDSRSVETLLIDSSGEQAVKRNADLTVKRRRYGSFGRPAAAISLYALQQFAPAGGKGNRTSMCGGGPMYTFVEPSEDATLWDVVWTNVPCGTPIGKEDANTALPWLTQTVDSKNGNEIHQPSPSDNLSHCAVWFGQPRRIRLQFSDERARCELTELDEAKPVVGVIQRPWGNNYGIWKHPASPYYRQKPGEQWLPTHPKPGRFGYRHYLGIALQGEDTTLRERSSTVRAIAERDREIDAEYPRVLVGGWAMDNMKPLGFLQSRIPVPLADLNGERAVAAAGAVRAATLMSGELAGSLKDALSVDEKATGSVSDARLGFFDDTEDAFRTYLRELAVGTDNPTAAKKWIAILLAAAISRFDALTEAIVLTLVPENAKRVLKARRRLANSAAGSSKVSKAIFAAMQLKPPETSKQRGVNVNSESATVQES